MPADFNWRAEDDHNWQEFAGGNESPEPKKRGFWRPWMKVVFALLIVASGIWLVFNRLQNFLSEAETATEAKVLSSYDLVQLAVDGADPELMVSVLSGRDGSWTEAQLSLLEQGQFFDRQALGLRWQGQDESREPQVTLSSDLTDAEVTTIQSYHLAAGNGVTETIRLQQTLVYRVSRDRWLLAPPEEEFYGNPVSVEGRLLHLTYPERDQEIGRRLAGSLEDVLASTCASYPELECDENFHLEVEFSTDPQSLLDLIPAESLLQSGDSLVLPAPTLVGLPVDDAGYRGLYRAYARRIVSALVSEQLGWECCDHALAFQAMLDLLLADIGLQPWPLSAADQERALREPLDADHFNELWQADDLGDIGELWRLQAVVAMINSQPYGQSAAAMQRQLVNTNNFSQWRGRLAPELSVWSAFAEAWRGYWRKVAVQLQAASDILPEQQIALMCNDGSGREGNLYRFNPLSGDWQTALVDRDLVLMEGLPDDRGIILTEQFVDTGELGSSLWRDGIEYTIAQGDTFYTLAGRSDPEGRYVVLSGISQDLGQRRYMLLDSADCTAERGCRLLPIGGLPAWSPDGSQTLLSMLGEDRIVQIMVGNEQVQEAEALEPGLVPYWIDGDTYAAVQLIGDTRLSISELGGETLFSWQPSDLAAVLDEPPVGEPRFELELLRTFPSIMNQLVIPLLDSSNHRYFFIYDHDSQQMSLAFQSSDFWPLLPGREEPQLSVVDILASPHEADSIWLAAVDFFKEESYLFRYNWKEGKLSLAATMPELVGSFQVSPSGRFLSGTGVSGGDFSRYFYDLPADKMRVYAFDDELFFRISDWAAGDEWFLQLGSGLLALYAPASGDYHLIPHDFFDCSEALWVDYSASSDMSR